MTPAAVTTEYYAFDQKRAFVDAATALDNPLGVFDALARGNLPLAGINALKERRPLLFGQMKDTVIKYTMTRQQELPFNRRMLLGVAFDFPSDWSIGHIDSIQQALAVGNAPQSPNAPTAAPSKVNKDPGAGISPGLF
jgi:hypothetical protein